MYLKSLSLKGFKSFPDRTSLKFGEGVNVVVGPNGSGKSNITDAVLWVLGEQSPTAVRGQSMQDVIFAGGHGQQARSSAEVELVLDNSDGMLPLDFPEISILRRLDRSGEGEYRLNGARCRLVDVIELLSDTGLGKEAHSIISQGRVEALVTSKPLDRRLLIEEAAGLGKHRRRRRRAQLKLNRTQDNLDRALDVEREARLRLKPLKRQAEAAELHERLRRQINEAKWELARERVRSLTAAALEQRTAADAARAARAEIEQQLAEVAKRREQTEQELQQHGVDREALVEDSFNARGASERTANRIEQLERRHTELKQRIEQDTHQLAVLEQQLAQDSAANDEIDKIAKLENELKKLEQQRVLDLEQELKAYEQECEQTKLGQESAEQGLLESRSRLTEIDQALQAARANTQQLQRQVELARSEAAKVGGELAAVNQFLRSQSGGPGGSSSLADHLEVDSGHELALAAALGRRLMSAVVSDRGSAQQTLDRVGSDGGSALVIDAGADSVGAGKSPAAGAKLLIDLVRCDQQHMPLAKRLLANVWVVERIEQVAADFNGVAVTTSGRLWDANFGELQQVPAGGADRILAERNRRDDLLKQTEAVATAQQQAINDYEAAKLTEEQQAAQRAEANTAVLEALRKRDEAAEQQRRAQARLQHRKQAPDEGAGALRRAELRAEIASERNRTEQITRQRSERAERIKLLQQGLERYRELVPQLQRAVTALKEVAVKADAERAALEAKLQEGRQRREQIANQLREHASAEAQLQQRLHATAEQLTTAEVAAQRGRDQLQDAKTELEGLNEQLGLDTDPLLEPLPQERRDQLQAQIERLLRRREQLGPVNPLAQDEYEEALEHVTELETQRADLEASLRELKGFIRDTDKRIRETFEATFAAAAKNFQEVVKDLFPGGHGQLKLVDPRQPQEADKNAADTATDSNEQDAEQLSEDPDQTDEPDILGVEIELRPAGKTSKPLSLLSGGEKSLTALAFMFSVFLARPCPFYVLDEVEAALDDLNITRFIELVRRYADRAQFIVVTHQKRTMEAADYLYGVSMAANGISKVVSRKLAGTQLAIGAES